MGKTPSFKDEFTFDQRVEESRDIIAKYPNRVPVIVERYSKSDLPEMEKKKYLVPRDMSVGQCIHILSSRLRLSPGKSLCVREGHITTNSYTYGLCLRVVQRGQRVSVYVLQQRENLWLWY
ncbi:Autophagy-related protein 8i [Hibiscus syriacus]|uniref:Autophagy-related protein n=1 Tax=Hibiscus syriacus TaxID=106335 RepID=A0A6A3A0N0_HIBSY|nr:Autophagy-related protein 8i [Hibiscus syriacus]